MQVSPTPREQQFVVEPYIQIAEHFSVTRAYLWNCVKRVIKDLTPGSLVIEVGSGNGKNLRAISERKDIIAIGCDIIPEFTRYTQSPSVDSILATNLNIPFRTMCADFVLSIAVVHHFDSEERRRWALEQLLQLVKPGGKMMVLVWALEQPTESRRKFTEGDNLVSWSNCAKTEVTHRFYHVFKEGELIQLLVSIPLYQKSFKCIDSWYERGNWVVYLQRENI